MNCKTHQNILILFIGIWQKSRTICLELLEW